MEWNKIQQKALLGILIGHGLYRWINLGIDQPNTPTPFSLDTLESMAWINDLPSPERYTHPFYQKKPKIYTRKNKAHLPSQKFFGDTVQASTWESWGCSPKQAATVHRMANQRNRPWNADEVKACPFIPSSVRNRVAPLWMVRDATPEVPPIPAVKARPTIDINLSDSLTLLEIPGVGPFWAGKILDTRRQVGGFHSLQQLRWLPGMRPGKCDSICNFLTLSPVPIKTFSFAYAGREDYFKIPGFPKKAVYQIINYRNRYGPFQSPEDWVKMGFLSDTLLQDILPYLKFP